MKIVMYNVIKSNMIMVGEFLKFQENKMIYNV